MGCRDADAATTPWCFLKAATHVAHYPENMSRFVCLNDPSDTPVYRTLEPADTVLDADSDVFVHFDRQGV